MELNAVFESLYFSWLLDVTFCYSEGSQLGSCVLGIYFHQIYFTAAFTVQSYRIYSFCMQE